MWPPKPCSPDWSLEPPAGVCMAQRHAQKFRVRALWQALCVLQDLGPGNKSQQPQFRCTPIDPRCPIFQHPLPPELSITAADSQSTTAMLDRARPCAHGLTLSALASCAWETRFSLFSVCLLAIHIWQEMSLRHSAAAVAELRRWSPRAGCCPVAMPLHLPIPGNPCREETKNSLLLAQHAVRFVPWHKFRCGCVNVPGPHCLETGSAVPSICTNPWYQHPPVTARSSLFSPAALSKSKYSKIALFLAVALRLDLKY